jgi:DNA adenine methylase
MNMEKRIKDKIYVPPIKCQGIKTKIVSHIKENVNWDGEGRWIEPFLGSGVVLFNILPKKALVGDTNIHIIKFYNMIREGKLTSSKLKSFLENEGIELEEMEDEKYYEVRNRFNETSNSKDFLFLNRSCFNGIMRFNRKGGFNVPFGHKPKRFSKSYITKITNQVKHVESVINKNWKFVDLDWRNLLKKAKSNDFVYLDPPYIGRHADYYNKWDENEAEELAKVAKKLPCPFILSMWSKNKYRENEHLQVWKDFKIKRIKHFYHVGSKESFRNEMEEVLIIKD